MLRIFFAVTTVIGWLAKAAQWMHDREQQRLGATETAAAVQNVALKKMQATLEVSRTATDAELKAKLNDGSL